MTTAISDSRGKMRTTSGKRHLGERSSDLWCREQLLLLNESRKEWLTKSLRTHENCEAEAVRHLVDSLDVNAELLLERVTDDNSLNHFVIDLDICAEILISNAVAPFKDRPAVHVPGKPGLLSLKSIEATVVRFGASRDFWSSQALRRLRSLSPGGGYVNDWRDVEITFLTSRRVQVRLGKNRETQGFRDLGFADDRGNGPDLAWKLMSEIAHAGGTLKRNNQNDKQWELLVIRVATIRQRLKHIYKIPADPLPYERGVGYKASFKISCAPSFFED